MSEINLEIIGQTIGVISVLIVAAWSTYKGHKQGDKKPPSDRPPSQHETRTEIAGLRSDLATAMRLITDAIHRLERSNGTLAEDHRELRRILDDLDREVRRIR